MGVNLCHIFIGWHSRLIESFILATSPLSRLHRLQCKLETKA